MDLYNVVFEGKLLPNKNINTVKAEFGKLFKIQSLKKVNSFFSGHAIVLKKSISLEQAEVYERALLKVGAYCRHQHVEPEQVVETINFEVSEPEHVAEASQPEQDENTESDRAEKKNSGIEFEYGAINELNPDVEEAPGPVSGTPAADEGQRPAEEDDQPEDEGPGAIDFEYGAVETLDEQLEEPDQAIQEVAVDQEDEQAIDDEKVAAIEFEYAVPDPAQSPAGESELERPAAQHEGEAEQVTASPLPGLSLVPIEEEKPDDEDYQDDQDAQLLK